MRRINSTSAYCTLPTRPAPPDVTAQPSFIFLCPACSCACSLFGSCDEWHAATLVVNERVRVRAGGPRPPHLTCTCTLYTVYRTLICCCLFAAALSNGRVQYVYQLARVRVRRSGSSPPTPLALVHLAYSLVRCLLFRVAHLRSSVSECDARAAT